jgi:hypothetical protein
MVCSGSRMTAGPGCAQGLADPGGAGRVPSCRPDSPPGPTVPRAHETGLAASGWPGPLTRSVHRSQRGARGAPRDRHTHSVTTVTTAGLPAIVSFAMSTGKVEAAGLGLFH